MDLEVLYEDNHILVVNKPAGTLAQGDHSGERSLLDQARDYIKVKYMKPGNVFMGLVHRLDREVSGIIIFARTSKAARRLHQQFLAKEVKKYYAAVVKRKSMVTYEKNKWVQLVHFLRKQRGYTEVYNSDSGNMKKGELRFIVVDESGEHLFILVELITGRKHQIRAQLATAGLPVSGDMKYGSDEELEGGAISLHSLSIHFRHPVKNEELIFFSKLPLNFQKHGFSSKEFEENLSEIIINDLETAGKNH